MDAIWLTPFYASPMADGGYDVADYRDVDPLFGTLADFDALIARRARARASGSSSTWCPTTPPTARVVPGGAAPPARQPERDRYIFRDGTGPNGDCPPNNWESIFGGPAWTRVEPDGPGSGTCTCSTPSSPT